MVAVHVERLDHFGVIAAVIKDLGVIDMINARLVPDAQEVLTPGEAVAGMSLTGLGVAKRPLSLPPHFLPTHRSICCSVRAWRPSTSMV